MGVIKSSKEHEDNIDKAWDSTDTDYLKQPVAGMPGRMVKCPTIKGSLTNY